MGNQKFCYLAKVEILDPINHKQSIAISKVIKSAFQDLIENKNITKFDEIMSPELKIHKNNEIWDYNTAYNYIKSLISDYKQVKFLPLDMLLINNNYVTIKFTESLHHQNGNVENHRFISIFEIKENKIKNIWELSVIKESNDNIILEPPNENVLMYLNDL